MKVKKIFFSTQAKTAVEFLTLLAIVFAFYKSQEVEDMSFNLIHLAWISLTIVHIIQNWKSIKTSFKENLGE